MLKPWLKCMLGHWVMGKVTCLGVLCDYRFVCASAPELEAIYTKILHTASQPGVWSTIWSKGPSIMDG